MSGSESKVDEQAIAIEYVALQWQFRCRQVHGDGDPSMAYATVKGGTVDSVKCKTTTERIADMNLRWKIEDGRIETRVSPERFDHFPAPR